MTDNELELSRRKVLAGLGTIGVASAGAGLGTSAWLSDQESFLNNRIMAGSLDLKVDWEEHYYDESNGAQYTRLVDGPNDVGEDEIGMPDPNAPIYAVQTDSLGAFMDATSIEAYPDNDNEGDGDGIQDDLANYDACTDLADMDEDLDPNGEKGLRTANADTLDANGDPKPLVSLEDVKPGDFGELTLSYHLCDNPGYVWLTGGLRKASENGVTEPEDENDDEVDGEVELLDAIQTMLWYDEDGDNVYEPGGESGSMVDVMLVLDRSGSMSNGKLSEEKTAAKNLVNALNLGPNAANVGVVSFASGVSVDQTLTDSASDAESAINGLTADGTTNIESAVDTASTQLQAGRPGADKIMVLLSDGAPNVNGDGDPESASDYNGDGDTEFANVDPNDNATDAKNVGIELYTIGFGLDTSTDFGAETAGLLEAMATDSAHAYLGGTGDLTQIFGQISQSIAGEECFFSGSLRDLLTALGTDHGIPLDGDRSTQFEEVDDSNLPNAGDDPNRDCFVDSTTNALGLAWWLPTTAGNEIQSDSVRFDVGFYTEQCRHNDGAGLS